MKNAKRRAWHFETVDGRRRSARQCLSTTGAKIILSEFESRDERVENATVDNRRFECSIFAWAYGFPFIRLI